MIEERARRCVGLLGRPGFVGSVVALAGATAAAQLVTLLAMPLVTRLYTPADIGAVTLFLSFFSVWAALLSLRYESALLVAVDDAESSRLFQLASLCVALMSLLACPVLLAGQRYQLLGLELMPWWTAFLAVPILAAFGLLMLHRAVALRAGLVGPLARATVARSGANAIARVAFGAGGFGAPGLFLAELASALVPMLTLLAATRRHSTVTRAYLASSRELRAVMRKYERFPRFELPSVAVNQLATALPVPILAALHGAAAAGWYGLAALLVALPNAQIGKAVGDSFQMEFSRKVRAGALADARRMFRKVVVGLAVVGIVPYLAIMLLAPLVVVPLFGSQWSQVAGIAVVLAPWLYAAFVVSSVSTMLLVIQAQDLKLVYDIAALAANLAVYGVATYAALDLHSTVLAFTLANVACYAIYLAVQFIALERKLGHGRTTGAGVLTERDD